MKEKYPFVVVPWRPSMEELLNFVDNGTFENRNQDSRFLFWKEYDRLHQNRLDHYLEHDFRAFREATNAPDGMLEVFVSGGMDSACALAFAVRYASSRKRPMEWVKAVHFVRQNAYPAERRDNEFAYRLATAAGTTYEEYDITSILEGLAKVLPDTGPDILADERIARARTIVAHTLVDYDGALTIDSHNLTEHFLAQWTTGMYCGQFSIISELFKSEVSEFAAAMETFLREDGLIATADALSAIRKRDKCSSELRNGTIGPTKMKDYDWLDRILYLVLTGTSMETALSGLSRARRKMAVSLLARMRIHRHRDHSGSPIAEMSGRRVLPKEQYLERVRNNPLARILDIRRQKRWLHEKHP